MTQALKISITEQIECLNLAIEDQKGVMSMLSEDGAVLAFDGEHLCRLIAVRETLKTIAGCQLKAGRRELPVLHKAETLAEAEASVASAILMGGALKAISLIEPSVEGAEAMKTIANTAIGDARAVFNAMANGGDHHV